MFLISLPPAVAAAAAVTQADIDALERDLGRTQDAARRAELLGMLMEGLVERCFPSDSRLTNPVARDDWSRSCLTRAVEVAEEIAADPTHRDRSRALFVAGKASFALNRPSAAEDLLTRFIDEYPDDPEVPLAHYSLAEKAYSAGEFETATEHYRGAEAALAGAEAARPRYRLAWCHQKTGDVAGGIDVLAILLAAPEGLDEVQRTTARGDLVAMATELADAETTVEAACRGTGGDAAALVFEVASALMTEGRHEAADEHFAALLNSWAAHSDAPVWQLGRLDSAYERDDWLAVSSAAAGLMLHYGPDSEFMSVQPGNDETRLLGARIEEAVRDAIGRIHQRALDKGPVHGVPGPGVERLYTEYLKHYEGAAKAPQMRLALGSVYHEQGKGLDALATFLEVVDDQAGRELGAQAGRLAADEIKKGLDKGGDDTPAFEDGLIQLADLFARGYPRHSDGIQYALAAGRVLADRGNVDEATATLVAAALRLPASPEASACAALAVEIHLEAEAWERALEVIEQLLDESRLLSAHPSLTDVLRASRAAASFNQAMAVWETGDPGTAASLFDAVATDAPDGDLAPKAMYNAAICHGESGNGSRAAMTLRRLFTGHPDSELAPEAMSQAAYLRYEKGEYTGAADLYAQLVDAYPGHEQAAYHQHMAAALYDQEGVFDRAIESYENLLKRYPDSAEATEARPRLEELKAGE